MTAGEIEKWKKKLDGMSQEELARLHRFAPSGHPVFTRQLPLYEHFKRRFQGIDPGDFEEDRMVTMDTKEEFIPTVALDFDGVIHEYHGWNDGRMGPPIRGAKEAINTLLDNGFRVVIFSTREAPMIHIWWQEHNMPVPVTVTNKKPLAVVLVDDRAITFDGHWSPGLIQRITHFKAHWEKADGVSAETGTTTER